MYPPCGDEECLSLLELELVAPVHHVAQEGLGLARQPHPPLVQGQVSGARTDQEEVLLTCKHGLLGTVLCRAGNDPSALTITEREDTMVYRPKHGK